MLGMKNTTLAENCTLKGKSVNIEKSAILNDTPTYFVRAVTVPAIKRKGFYPKAYICQSKHGTIHSLPDLESQAIMVA